MTQIAHRLRHRVTFQVPVDTPNMATGGSARTYTDLASLWGELLPISPHAYAASRQIDETTTHALLVRRAGLMTIAEQGPYNLGFNLGFDSDYERTPAKIDVYVWLPFNDSTVRGRRFRIRRAMDADERREYVTLWLEEYGEDPI